MNDTSASEAVTPASATSSTIPLEPDDPPTDGGRLVVGVPADVNGWNPNIDQWTDGGTMMGPSMLEPLVTEDREGEIEPLLAESLTHNASFTEWTITVREGVRFHNNELLDATAVKRSLEAYAKTGLTSVALSSIYERIEVTGPRTVTINLTQEWALFPATLIAAYIVAPEMLERTDEGTTFPIGTGPFRFVEWRPKTFLKVGRWDGYWRKGPDGARLPHLDEIEFRPMTADDTRVRGLRTGELDLALTSDPASARNLESRCTVLRDYTTERTLLILNTEEGFGNLGNPFTNVHARRALAHATDSAALARLVGEDVQVTTQGYRPDSPWGLPADQTGYPSYDPDKARAELDIFRRETGKPTVRFTLKSVPEPRIMSILQKARDQWRSVGIESSIETLDQVPFTIVVAMGQYQAAYYRGYGVSNPDENIWFLDPNNVRPVDQLSLNFTHYKSPTLAQNIRTLKGNTTFRVRKAANDAIIHEINEQTLHVWLFDTPWAIIAQKRVRGLNKFRTHPFGNFVSKPWWGDVWMQS